MHHKYNVSTELLKCCLLIGPNDIVRYNITYVNCNSCKLDYLYLKAQRGVEHWEERHSYHCVGHPVLYNGARLTAGNIDEHQGIRLRWHLGDRLKTSDI